MAKDLEPQRVWFSSWPWAVVFFAAVLGLSAFNYYLLVPLKQSAIEAEIGELEHVSGTMGSSVSSMLRHVEGVLHEVEENYQRDTFGFRLRDYLQVEGSSIEAIKAITVRDDLGRVISSSTRQPNAIRDGALAYFKQLRREVAESAETETGQKQTLYFSAPVRSFSDGSWQLWMSVAQVDDSNEPLMIISAALDLRYIVDTLMPDAVASEDANALVDRDFRLLARNPSADDAIGRSVEDYPIYRKLAESGAPVATLEYDSPFTDTKRLGVAQWIYGRNFIITVSRSTEALLSAWWRSVLIAGLGSLGILLMIGTMWWVTARKAARDRIVHEALRDSERRFRLLIDGVTDYAIFMLDPEGNVAKWNRGAERILGYSADEIVGNSARKFFPERGQEDQEVGSPLDQAKDWGCYESEGWLLCKSDDRLWAHTVIQTIEDDAGDLLGFSMIAHDNSERNKLLTELRAAKVKAEEATAAKSEFLATMSHEIRTPLTGIMGYSRLALQDASMPEPGRSHIERVYEASRALRIIIDDILDFSKLESGRLSFETMPFSPCELVENSASIVGLMAEEKGLELKVNLGNDIPDWVEGDPTRLRQVLLNLLSNAIKFTPEGRVEVKLEALAQAEDEVTLRFAIIDTGIGIEEDDQKKLFARFSQADTSIARKFGGSGLGLSISKRIVDALDGDIGLKSECGVGSTFWFTLTLARAAPPETRAKPHAHTTKSLNVLMVDDLEMNRDLVKLLLQNAGHRVSMASDGETAVELAKDGPFDVILMDIQMPGVDGIEAARRIRALGPGPGDVPMIALTADVVPRSLESYEDAGFTGHMAKPINAEALMDLMDTLAEEAKRDEAVEGRHEARNVALCEGPRVSSKVDTPSR